MPELIGTSIGRYQLLEQIGSGGMGVVYKALDTHLDSPVAIKFLRTERLSLEMLDRTLKRFTNEARSVARLTHPNLVKVTDYGEYDGRPYLVMEYLPGGTLKDKLGQPMPWREAVNLLLPVSQALEYAHEQGIIHRDIKPSNILLTQKGQPMLSDFGLAKMLEQEPGSPDGLSSSSGGLGVGTPEYMAPEQWSGKVSPQTDIYSLGLVLYELITGRKPYDADTPVAIAIKQANGPLPKPGSFVPDLPEAVETFLIKALANNSEDRFQNLAEFIAGLEQLKEIDKAPQPVKVDAKLPAGKVVAAAKPSEPKIAGAKPPEPSISPTRKKISKWIWVAGIMMAMLVCGTLLVIGVNLIIPPTSNPPTSYPTEPPVVQSPSTRVGLVIDLGGINDKSFNTSAWKGATDAITNFGIEAKFLESQQQSDYARNIQQYLGEGTDLIVTVGFLLGVDTAKFAIANPNQKFAIVDYSYPDCWPGAEVGVVCGTDQELPNVRGLMFQTDQAAFMAGYLAAGMTTTGKVATYGGLQIPTVTIFMKGFEAGVKYYNQQKGAAVEVLGWNNATGEGVFSNGFESTDDGRQLATSFMEEGADIILPVAAQVGLGSAAVCKETGRCMIIGVDADWVETAPEYQDVILTSVLKRIDVAVYSTIKDLLEGNFTGGTVTYTIADGGVDIAPFHQLDSIVTAEMKAELEAIRAGLMDGSIAVDGY